MPAWILLRMALVCAVAGTLLSACFETRVAEPDKGGNSSETVALVGGKVVDDGGKSVSGAWVALVPDDFNPVKGAAVPSGLITMTDGKGEFTLSKVPKGRYGFEAKHPTDGTRLFSQGMDLKETVETIPVGTLRKPGRVRLRLPDYFKVSGGYIFLPHTRFAWPVTGTVLEHGYLDLDSLPASTYAALVFSRDTNLVAADTLARNLDLLPGGSINVGVFEGWTYSKRISLNTTATGSFIGTPVYGFPLLVRLDGTNFDFATVSGSGADLRFSKPDGSPIAYQIDHWDAAGKDAAVWVSLDTVRANDSAQYFRMQWGKVGVEDQSDGSAVFAGIGYAAAWHLEESAAGTGIAGIYRNSAANADHGLDSISTADQVGVIGNGVFFRDGEYIRIPSATAALRPPKAITLSAWVKPTAVDSSGGEIASMGNDYGIRVAANREAYVFNFNNPRYDSTNIIATTSGVDLMDGAWHHFAAILQSTHMDIYVDGVLRKAQDFPVGVLKYDGGPDFFIGHHGNGETVFDYIGHIDEVRMLPGISSAAWLRLSYLTQKSGSTALKFSP